MPRSLVKHYSGCVCEGVSDEINVGISGLSKEDCPPRCGWASSNPLKS